MKPWTSSLLLFVLSLSIAQPAASAADANEPSTDSWHHASFYELKTATTPPLTFVSISSIQGHLIAHCGYIDLKNTSPTAITGVKTSDGNFWPRVRYEVANNLDGQWKPIGVSTKQGNVVTLFIAPKDTDTILHVDLDLFRPTIDTWKYGRIVLDNEEATTFALKYLLPPETQE